MHKQMPTTSEKKNANEKRNKKNENIVIEWGRKGQKRRWVGRPNLDNMYILYYDIMMHKAQSRIRIAPTLEYSILILLQLIACIEVVTGRASALFSCCSTEFTFRIWWQCSLGVRIASRFSLDCEPIFGLHQWFFQILDSVFSLWRFVCFERVLFRLPVLSSRRWDIRK